MAKRQCTVEGVGLEGDSLMPRFSICIPVRNGAEYLKNTLRLCLEQLYFDDYEVVVSDNQSEEDIKGLIDSFHSEKIRYVRTKAFIGMGANFDYALDAACGDYKLIIGSDDGISRYALYILDRVIRITGERMIQWSRGEYYYPNHPWIQNKIGIYSQYGQNLIKGYDLVKPAIKAINADPPHIYDSAVVHKDLIREIEEKTGRKLHDSFLGDYYEGLMSAMTAGRYVKIKFPLSLYAERMGTAASKMDNNLTEEYIHAHHSRDEIDKLDIRKTFPDSVFGTQFYFYLQKYFILRQVIALFGKELDSKPGDIGVKRVIDLTLADYAYRAGIRGNNDEFDMAVERIKKDLHEYGDEGLIRWYEDKYSDTESHSYISHLVNHYDTDEKIRFQYVINCGNFGAENVYDAMRLLDDVTISKKDLDEFLDRYEYAYHRAEEVCERIRQEIPTGGMLGIYGAGRSGTRVVRMLRYFITDMDFKVTLFDRNAPKAGYALSQTWKDYMVLPPSEIKNVRLDGMVISPYRYEAEIRKTIWEIDADVRIMELFEENETNWISFLVDK